MLPGAEEQEPKAPPERQEQPDAGLQAAQDAGLREEREPRGEQGAEESEEEEEYS